MQSYRSTFNVTTAQSAFPSRHLQRARCAAGFLYLPWMVEGQRPGTQVPNTCGKPCRCKGHTRHQTCHYQGHRTTNKSKTYRCPPSNIARQDHSNPGLNATMEASFKNLSAQLKKTGKHSTPSATLADGAVCWTAWRCSARCQAPKPCTTRNKPHGAIPADQAIEQTRNQTLSMEKVGCGPRWGAVCAPTHRARPVIATESAAVTGQCRHVLSRLAFITNPGRPRKASGARQVAAGPRRQLRPAGRGTGVRAPQAARPEGGQGAARRMLCASMTPPAMRHGGHPCITVA